MVASINIALLLTSTIGGVLAAPTLLERGKTFSISAIHNDKFVRNGTAAMLKAYAKYGMNFSNADSVLGRRQDSSTTANAVGRVEYTCPVTIGGQTLNLDLDTGSADLWVYSTLLPSSDLQGHNYFDPSQSSDYIQTTDSTWSIGYGDGSSASGVVGIDTVTVGGTTSQGQVIELANQISAGFDNDGIMGLAFSTINTVKPVPQWTFFERAVAEESLSASLFAAYLPQGTDGAYDFGFTDSSKYSGDMVFASVDSSKGWWKFDSQSYMVGDQTYDATGTVGIADTGTSLILMQPSQVSQYYSAVPGAQQDPTRGYIFPCGAELPNLSFLIGDSVYATIPGSSLNFETIDSVNCLGGLQPVGDGFPNIYGDIFFNAYYSVFSLDGPQFGFAPIA